MSSAKNDCVDLLSSNSDDNNNSDSDELEVWQGYCIQHHPFDRAAADQEEDIEPVGAEISADVVDMLLDDDDDDDDSVDRNNEDAKSRGSADDSVEIVDEIGITNTASNGGRGNGIVGATTAIEGKAASSRKPSPGKPQHALTAAAETTAGGSQINTPNNNQVKTKKRKRSRRSKKKAVVNTDKKEHDIAVSRASVSTTGSSPEVTDATEKKNPNRRKRARTKRATNTTAAFTPGDDPTASNENKNNESNNKNDLTREARVERMLARNERWRQVEDPQKELSLCQKREKKVRSKLVSLLATINAVELDDSCNDIDRNKKKQERKRERGLLARTEKKLERNLQMQQQLKLEIMARELRNANSTTATHDDKYLDNDIKLEYHIQEVNNNVKLEEADREITRENASEAVLESPPKPPGKAIEDRLDFDIKNGTTGSHAYSLSPASKDGRNHPEKIKQEQLVPPKVAANKPLASSTPHKNAAPFINSSKVPDSRSTAKKTHANFATSVSVRSDQEEKRNSLQESMPPKKGSLSAKTAKTGAGFPDSIKSAIPDDTIKATVSNASVREASFVLLGDKDGKSYKDPKKTNRVDQPHSKPQPAIETHVETTESSVPLNAKAPSVLGKKFDSLQRDKTEVVSLIDSDSEEEKTAAKAGLVKLPKNESDSCGSYGNLKAPPPATSVGISREIKKEKLSQLHENTLQEKGKKTNLHKDLSKPKAEQSTPESGKKKAVNVDAGRNFIMIEDSSDDDSDIECFVLPGKKRKAKVARPTKPVVDSEQTGRGRSPAFACSTPTQRKKYVSAKNPLPNSFQSRRTFTGTPSSRFHDKHHSLDYSQEAAEKEQDRLFQETLKRLRSKGGSSHATNTTFYQSTSGFSKNQMLRMTNKAQFPVFSSPLVDIAKQYPDHWNWPNLHARLGLPANAGPSLVKKHYRKLALLYHPDKSRFSDSSARFMAITAAYKKLIS